MGVRRFTICAIGIILAVGALFADVNIQSARAGEATYYVSTTGNDRNPGTIAAPWRSIQKAANTVVPGDTVYIRGGVYREKVSIPTSGNSNGGSITFQSYPGEKAVLDGSGLSVSSGTDAMIKLEDKSYVTIKDLEIRNYKTSKKNKTAIAILVTGKGSHIEIRNNHIHHIESLVKSKDGGDAHGIAVYGTSAADSINNIVIDGNDLHHLKLGSSEALALNGNVENFLVTNNRVHDSTNIGIVLIGFEGTSSNSLNDQARNGLVKGNAVYNISSYGNPAYGKEYSAGGIYVDGGKNIVIEENRSYSNDIGIEVASEHKGKSASNITVRNNLIYNNHYTGIAMGGYDSKRGSTTDSRIINNTIYKNDTKKLEGGQLLLQHNTRNNVIKNNIIVASSSNILIANDSASNAGNLLDYNLYYGGKGSKRAVWNWKKKSYTGFAEYQKRTGNDAHSRFENPLFVKEASFDLHLQTTSPAVNKGQFLPELGSVDIDGQPRVQGGTVDVGADEKM